VRPRFSIPRTPDSIMAQAPDPPDVKRHKMRRPEATPVGAARRGVDRSITKEQYAGATGQ